MTLFSAFSRQAPNRVFIAVLLGAFGGVAYSSLIPLVLNVLAPGDPRFHPASAPQPTLVLGFEVSNYSIAVLFVFVCVSVLIARSASQILLAHISMSVASRLRMDMYHRIVRASVVDLERIGASRVMAALTTDVPRVIAGARLFPELLTNVASLLGLLAFLCYLQPAVFRFVAMAILFGIVTYQVPRLIGRRYIERARTHLDALHEGIRGLLRGVKELKLDPDKRDDYFRHYLVANEVGLLQTETRGQTLLRAAATYGNLLMFFVVGAITFVVVNYYAIRPGELIGIVMVLLYITGPVALLLNTIPQLAAAGVSLRTLQKLMTQLPIEPESRITEVSRGWRTMKLTNASFNYPKDDSDRAFALGPVDLDIHRGELTFIVGGNGSGKSTLAKLITLHYLAASGQVTFDEETVTADNLVAYRRQIASIYSDYHLFQRVLGVRGNDVPERVQSYLQAFGLDGVVSFDNSEFSTLSLSDGQKRRLALIVAALEDKELYLFDEWAADQDTSFKDAFYRRVLPELKAQGKAVVVITHDDRYFELADCLVFMEAGKVLRVETPPTRLMACAHGTRQNDLTGR